MSVINACNAAIYSKLAGGTALTGALGGTFIYSQIAPSEQPYPYIIYSLVSGGPLNETPSDEREMLYFARAYSDKQAQAGSIDALVSSLLHRGTITVTGYTNYRTEREQDFSNVEKQPNGNYAYMAGANYRISLDS